MLRLLVTGGAGFIGSNLVAELLKNKENEVFVFDNLISSKLSNLDLENPRLRFYKVDLRKSYFDWPQIDNLKIIFHLAANADVRGGQKDRNIDFEQNVMVTKSICDYAVKNCADHVAFASSATVYGEPDIFPTKEFNISSQTSVYGASKLSCEAYLQAYSEYGDFKTTIFRFVSWIGFGYSHGVIYDFYKKLQYDKKSLEILGDGNQKKSFLDVQDGIKGIISLINHNQKSAIFNLGHDEIMSVDQLGKIVCNYLNLKDIKFKYTGSKRGWIGDSPLVHLDISKAKSFGWKPEVSIKQGITNTLNYLTQNKKNIFR